MHSTRGCIGKAKRDHVKCVKHAGGAQAEPYCLSDESGTAEEHLKSALRLRGPALTDDVTHVPPIA